MEKQFNKDDFLLFLNKKLELCGIMEEDLSVERAELIADIVEEYINQTK